MKYREIKIQRLSIGNSAKVYHLTSINQLMRVAGRPHTVESVTKFVMDPRASKLLLPCSVEDGIGVVCFEAMPDGRIRPGWNVSTGVNLYAGPACASFIANELDPKLGGLVRSLFDDAEKSFLKELA